MQSRPTDPHPLFASFIGAAIDAAEGGDSAAQKGA